MYKGKERRKEFLSGIDRRSLLIFNHQFAALLIFSREVLFSQRIFRHFIVILVPITFSAIILVVFVRTEILIIAGLHYVIVVVVAIGLLAFTK